jgi:hypothetical protein
MSAARLRMNASCSVTLVSISPVAIGVSNDCVSRACPSTS